MSWLRKKPRHQQQWYWAISPETFQIQFKKGWNFKYFTFNVYASDFLHYNNVIMCAMASQIMNPTIGYWTVYSRRRPKKTLKLRVTGLCARNSPLTGQFAAQMTSNAENVSIWWRHHGVLMQVTWPLEIYMHLSMLWKCRFCWCFHYRNQNWIIFGLGSKEHRDQNHPIPHKHWHIGHCTKWPPFRRR